MNGVNTVYLCDEDAMQEISMSEITDKSHLHDNKMLKLLKSFSRFLFVDEHKQCQQIKSYNKLLKKLEEKEISLKKKLKSENDEKKRKTIEMRLEVNSAQRGKAITAINVLNNRN